MSQQIQEALHQQETDFQIVEALLPFLNNSTFIDIGAEKGTFTEVLVKHGFTGTLIEPLPKHSTHLKNLADKSNSIFLSYAIDNEDHHADFFIACDSNGEPLDYFHSLNYLGKDERVHHEKKIPVTCRSLNSLLREGVIQKHIGVIKTDTEGNDFNVLQGSTDIEAEIIVCEFFMPGIYAGWEQGDPFRLIEQANKLGFNHFISIKRFDHFEFVSIDSTNFIDMNWGNLIFIKDEIFNKATHIFHQIIAENSLNLATSVAKRTSELRAEVNVLQTACDERLKVMTHLQNELVNLKQGLNKPPIKKWFKKIL